MNKETQKVLDRISKLCQDNIDAFGDSYDPRWRTGNIKRGQMKGAKAEGRGVVDMAKEILTEIENIKKEDDNHHAPLDLNTVFDII